MCGVLGLISRDVNQNLAEYAYHGLLSIQHRGQDGAGITSYCTKKQQFFSHRSKGLVTQVFNKEVLDGLYGDIILAHNRYPTAGGYRPEDLQPQVMGYPHGLAMAHNGNIVNTAEISNKFKMSHSVQFLSKNDIESFMLSWSITWDRTSRMSMSFKEQITECAKDIFKNFVGGYATVGIIANQGMFAIRDPNGIRPLVLGAKYNESGLVESYCISSETSVLQRLGHTYLRDIEPGEFVYISKKEAFESDSIFSFKYNTEQPKKTCMFEWVYFSAAESQIENKSVYEVRLNLGVKLADSIKEKVKDISKEFDVVCPVPDTSRTSAISLAENLSLPYREALIKNRYIHRSFIISNQVERDKALTLKLTPVLSEIKNKNILLVDDSLVRGSTSRKIIRLLKDMGANSVSLALTCPEIKHPCYYGIDFPDPSELACKERENHELAEWIGAKQVFFLGLTELKDAIGLGESLCMGCLTGKYPTHSKDFSSFQAERIRHRKDLG